MRRAERLPGGRLAIIMALIERHPPDARRSWRLDRPRDPTSTLCRPLANAQYKAYYMNVVFLQSVLNIGRPQAW
jgi:hypothetical protein